jgi:diguanylate cyclase (GGDEF)-like protein/PAS domain S-box-containing protein
MKALNITISGWMNIMASRKPIRDEAIISDITFRELFDLAADCMLVLGSDGVIREINRAGHEQLGYTRAEMVGSHLSRFISPEYAAIIGDRIAELQEKGFLIYESAQVCKDGTVIPVEINSRTFQLDGQPAFLSIVRNITERKLIEHALQQSEHDLKEAQSIAHFGSWTHDMAGHITWSDELYKIFGVSPESFTPNAESFSRLIHPDDLAAMQAWNEACASGLQPGPIEWRCIRPDGSVRHIYGQGELILDARGRVIHMAGTVQDITEQKKTELKYLASEEKWRLLFENMTTGFALHDVICDVRGKPVDYRFLEINPAYERLTGLKAGNVIGRTVLEALPGTEPYWIETFGRVALTGEPTDYENYSSELGRWYQVRAFSPKIGQFAVIVADITDRKKAELALQQSERWFRSIFENVNTGIASTDDTGRVTSFNEAFRTMLGYDAESLSRMNFADFTHPEDLALEQDIFADILEGKRDSYQMTKRYITSVGSIIWVDLSAAVIRNADGKVANFVAVVQDITERKKLELAIAESEKEFRQLAEAMPQIVWITRADGWNIYFNQQWVDYTGLSLEESYGHGWNKPFHPDDQQRAWEAWQKAVLEDESYEIECRLRRADGEYLWWLIRGVPVFGEDGRIDKWFGTCTDINEIKLNEQNLLIAATAFESQESLMITDASGVIIRVNNAFTESTGYAPEEVMGKTPQLLKSGRHSEEFYRDMWKTLLGTGKWQGEVWDRRKNGQVYPKWLAITAVKNGEGKVTHYVGSHIDITARKAAEEEIQYLAFYDPLTRLPNRRLLLDRLNQALVSSARSGRSGALLFIDLDNFKNLNDTLGHDIGDLLLQQVTLRLESCIRSGDTVARLGGDEFVVMLLNMSSEPLEAAAQSEAICEKILAALGRTYQLGAHTYHCTASVGVTLFGNEMHTTDELMKQADIAMYQSKKAGRNTLRFFDRKMQESIASRVSLENELHNALEFRQFHLYYQIQVDSTDRQLGAEALIRWIHPQRGLVSPAQFIPLAEESGLILPVGQWVLDTACARIKEWEQDARMRDLVIAVNVSAKQFRQHNFIEQVQVVVQRHGINPSRLKLELTEGMLLENIEETITTMNALNELGVKFSLDDFGTGYSSLQYLKRLPLDQIKIDQSFVRDITSDPNDAAIVQTIIAMAEVLGLEVVAEGVETDEQREFLELRGCTHFQGYLFGKPVPIEQFEAMIKQR